MHQRQQVRTIGQVKQIIVATIAAVTLAVTVVVVANIFNPFCYIFPKDSIEWIAAGCGW